MKTRTLHALVQSFDQEARYLEAVVLHAADPQQEDFFKQRMQQTAVIAANLRREILARRQPGNRDLAEAQRFEDWLKRALEAYLDLAPENRLEVRRNVA